MTIVVMLDIIKIDLQFEWDIGTLCWLNSCSGGERLPLLPPKTVVQWKSGERGGNMAKQPMRA